MIEPRCSNCRRQGLTWDKPAHVKPRNLAIRCAYCMRVFCLRCARLHFAPDVYSSKTSRLYRPRRPPTKVSRPARFARDTDRTRR